MVVPQRNSSSQQANAEKSFENVMRRRGPGYRSRRYQVDQIHKSEQGQDKLQMWRMRGNASPDTPVDHD